MGPVCSTWLRRANEQYKIQVANPLVVLHGDEMAQIAFERILEQFVKKRLDIELVEIDLTAENRLITNGQAVVDAIAPLNNTGWASRTRA